MLKRVNGYFRGAVSEVIISHLDQNKQYKCYERGILEVGTPEAMSTEAHVKLQKSGAGRLDFYPPWKTDRYESLYPTFGGGTHPIELFSVMLEIQY